MRKPQQKATLLTNISFVSVQNTPMRCDAFAVLIEADAHGILGPDYRVRGFTTDGSTPVFTYWLKPEQLPFTLAPATSTQIVMLREGEEAPQPIFTGTLLKFTDGPEFFLQAQDSKRPLDVVEFDGSDYEAIWRTLAEKVNEYWDDQLWMPHVSWGSPRKMRHREVRG